MNYLSYRLLLCIVLAVFALPLSAGGPEQTVVLHLKDGNIEAGLAGESAPRFSMPAVIGTSASPGPMIGMGGTKTYYGNEALERKATLKITYALEPGGNTISDRNAFEALVQHILSSKLQVEPDEVAVVLNEAANSTDEAREATTQLFFETFGVAGFFMSPHFTSWSMTSGMAADSTFAETMITPDEYDEIGPEVIHRKSPK